MGRKQLTISSGIGQCASLCLVILFPLSFVTQDLGIDEPSHVGMDCTVHPPIVILGDLGFANPLSGVVSGSGTSQDPFIIEGWCIFTSPRTDLADGIRLEDTAAHVIIRNNVIASPVPVPDTDIHLSQGTGIVLSEVDNVAVKDNVVKENGGGIWIFRGGHTIHVKNNTIIENARSGLVLEQVWHAMIEDNEVSRNHAGINVHGGFRGAGWNVIRNNTVEDNVDRGIMLAWGADEHLTQPPSNNTIMNNVVKNSGDWGIFIIDNAKDNLVVANSVENHKYGVWVCCRSGNDVLNNSIHNNGMGIFLSHGAISLVHGNKIAGNGVGLVAEDVPEVTATLNWWGCREGPGYEGCDSIDGNVDYDPWLVSPSGQTSEMETSTHEISSPGPIAFIGLFYLAFSVGRRIFPQISHA